MSVLLSFGCPDWLLCLIGRIVIMFNALEPHQVGKKGTVMSFLWRIASLKDQLYHISTRPPLNSRLKVTCFIFTPCSFLLSEPNPSSATVTFAWFLYLLRRSAQRKSSKVWVLMQQRAPLETRLLWCGWNKHSSLMCVCLPSFTC